MSRSQASMNLDAAVGKKKNKFHSTTAFLEIASLQFISSHTVGINDGAYFIGRKEILEFLNNQLDMNLEKIEQTASGAVACQLMDKFFPGSIQIKRVNWEAKSDFQYIENYKLLQAAFSKCNIQKHIDVDRLIRAKYQDNLEFCQWLKAFFEQVSHSTTNQSAGVIRESYDPLSRRILGKGGNNLEAHFMPSKMTSKILPQGRPHTSAGVSNNAPANDAHTAVGRISLGNLSSTTSATSAATTFRRVSSIASTSSSITSGPIPSSMKRNHLSSKPPMPSIGVNNASPLSNSQNMMETIGANKNKRVAVLKEN